MLTWKKALALMLSVGLVAFFAGWRLAPVVRADSGTFKVTMPLFEEIYQTLTQSYVTPPDSSTLIRGAINGMTASLNDPYTAYYDPQQYQKLLQSLSGQFFGVGIEISQVGQYIVVQAVLPNSPALAAGMLAGDRITAVDGKNIVGDTPDQAATAIRGPKGSQVTLTVLRGQKTLNIPVTRGPISLPTVEDRMLQGGIAYIQLNQVSADAGAVFTAALVHLEASHPTGWILDLRNDPGGYVGQVVQIAENFIPSGTIVSFKGRTDNQVYTSKSGKKLGQPLVVLVNGGTASAAEILTGALQDDHLATVIGTKTFGKGIAQQLEPMKSGGVLKFTVAKWYTPKGRNIEKIGLTPDLYVDGTNPPMVMAERILGVGASLKSSVTVGSLEALSQGKNVVLDEPPTIQNGRLYLSLEGAAQLFGVDGVPSKDGKSATLRYGKQVLTVTAGTTSATLDGSAAVEPESFQKDGELMVPVRALMAITGTTVKASGQTYTFTNLIGTGQ